jgi:hypothetical protein
MLPTNTKTRIMAFSILHPFDAVSDSARNELERRGRSIAGSASRPRWVSHA